MLYLCHVSLRPTYNQLDLQLHPVELRYDFSCFYLTSGEREMYEFKLCKLLSHVKLPCYMTPSHKRTRRIREICGVSVFSCGLWATTKYQKMPQQNSPRNYRVVWRSSFTKKSKFTDFNETIIHTCGWSRCVHSRRWRPQHSPMLNLCQCQWSCNGKLRQIEQHRSSLAYLLYFHW